MSNSETIWISGAAGFIGTVVCEHLTKQGYRLIKLVRRASKSAHEIEWNAREGIVDARATTTPCDAVVHLAGESVAGGRLTTARKQRVYESRVTATRVLCHSLTTLPQPPRVLISASGIGIYGDRGDELLREDSSLGQDFLATLAQEWEAATAPARDAGMRVAHLRMGMVLHPEGGALQQMLTPFRWGVGGPLGSGRQFVSWISRDDVCAVIAYLLKNEALSGPFNLCAPQAIRMGEFARMLGKVLKRPAVFPVPAFVLKVLLGKELAGIVLTSSRAAPVKLLKAGYTFRDSDLSVALDKMLKAK